MTPKEFDQLRQAAYKAKAMAEEAAGQIAEIGFETAKKVVACQICGVWTANPRRVWRDGVHLCDMCNPCFQARKTR